MFKKLAVGALVTGLLLSSGVAVSAAEKPNENRKYTSGYSTLKSETHNNITIQVGSTAKNLYGINPRLYEGNFDLVDFWENGNGYSFSAKAIKKASSSRNNQVTILATHPSGDGDIYYHITVK
ncbi:hypothetical protein bcgnr5369_16300 [Bacillus cereus]